MKRTLPAALALLLTPLSAPAVVVAPPPVPQRVAQADAVVVGRVTALEDNTVAASPFPGAKEKVEYRVAVVKVEDALLGAKGLTHVKVGFVPPPEVPAFPGGRGIRRPLPAKLEVGQEVCLFLKRHPEADFYVLPAFNDVIDKKRSDFDKEVALARKCARALADPKAGLKSEDAGERTLTAGLLVLRYRGWRGPGAKTEPIDADESKLILTALAEADWGKPVARDGVAPQTAFNQLGLTEKDGWSWKPAPGSPPDAYANAAKAWLKAHAESYRIRRVVAEEK